MKNVFKFTKAFTTGVTILTVGVIGNTAYNGYQKSTTPSLFEEVATHLGFTGVERPNFKVTTNEQLEALLQVFYYAGYFKVEKLWQDINHLGFKNPDRIFNSLIKVLSKAKGDQDDPEQFNAKVFRKNFLNDTDLTKGEALAFLEYLGQNAFARHLNQERNEKKSESWMDSYKDNYMQAAAKLDLVEAILPTKETYDEAWITGASRLGMLTRLADFNYFFKNEKIKILNKIDVLAGARPAWIEIDGINPQILQNLNNVFENNTDVNTIQIPDNISDAEEGKAYIIDLAKKHNILLNLEQPIIVYKTKEECPEEYFPNRGYPNYVRVEDRDNKVISESLIAKDLVTQHFHDVNIEITHTRAINDQRPNTATTAKDVTLNLLNKIKSGAYDTKGEYEIYFQSNQPYVNRQTIVAQNIVNKTLQENSYDNIKINIHGVGFGIKENLLRIHSELGTLLYEKYQSALSQNPDLNSNIPHNKIAYSLRDNTPISTPLPQIFEEQEVGILGKIEQTAQHYFDKILD